MRVVGEMLDLEEEVANSEIVEAAIVEDPAHSDARSASPALTQSTEDPPVTTASRRNRAEREIPSLHRMLRKRS